ncbi:hypothetical protein JOQ06_025854, partial [Pogonophryne albipinna]
GCRGEVRLSRHSSTLGHGRDGDVVFLPPEMMAEKLFVWSEVTLAGWAPGRDPSGRQTAGRGTRSCCPSQPTGHLTGPKACQTDTPPRPGRRRRGGKGGVYGGG